MSPSELHSLVAKSQQSIPPKYRHGRALLYNQDLPTNESIYFPARPYGTILKELSINFPRRERKKYHSHRAKSRESLSLLMVWTRLRNNPNTQVIAKFTSGLWRVRTHVSGVLIHTKAPCGKLAFAFADLLQWPHDSNLTATLVTKSILKFVEDRPLPETLYNTFDHPCCV